MGIIIMSAIKKFISGEDDEDISAEEAKCCVCLPLKPALQLLVAYYMISIAYAINELARSYSIGMKVFAAIYGVFSIPYIALAVMGFLWLAQDTIETRVLMVNALLIKIVVKSCVDILALVQLLMMKDMKKYKEMLDKRMLKRYGRVTTGKMSPKQEAWIKEHGVNKWVGTLFAGFLITILVEIYFYCQGRRYRRLADIDEDSHFVRK